jgi:hypothetical protein
VASKYVVFTALCFDNAPQTIAIAIAVSLKILVFLIATVTGVVAVFLAGGLGDAFNNAT